MPGFLPAHYPRQEGHVYFVTQVAEHYRWQESCYLSHGQNNTRLATWQADDFSVEHQTEG